MTRRATCCRRQAVPLLTTPAVASPTRRAAVRDGASAAQSTSGAAELEGGQHRLILAPTGSRSRPIGPTPDRAWGGTGKQRETRARREARGSAGGAGGRPQGSQARGVRRGRRHDHASRSRGAGGAVEADERWDGGGAAGPAGGAGVGRHPPWGRGRPGGAGGCGRGPRGGVRRRAGRRPGRPGGEAGQGRDPDVHRAGRRRHDGEDHPAGVPPEGAPAHGGVGAADHRQRGADDRGGHRRQRRRHTAGRLLHRVGLDRAASPGAPDQGTSPPSSRPGARTRSTTPTRSRRCGAGAGSCPRSRRATCTCTGWTGSGRPTSRWSRRASPSPGRRSPTRPWP